MPSYNYKSPAELAYDAFKKRLRTEGAIILSAVLNEAIAVGTKRFNDELNNGGIPQIDVTPDTLRELLLAAAQHELAAPLEG
jgi:hypothetical protein